MDPMSIASLSTSMANTQNLQAVGTAVMSMALDATETMGMNTAAMLQSMPAPAMENSVNPHIGGNIDISG